MSGWFFGSWGLANPAGLLAGLLALPILALHVLRPRRVRRVVAAIFLWAKVERPVTAAQPWQRLIPSWLLAAQLLAVLLGALALAQPVRLAPSELGEHTIFVIDGSASMTATDGTPTRLHEAADRAKELRRQVPPGGEASLVVAGAEARALLTRSTDITDFDLAVDTLTEPGSTSFIAGSTRVSSGAADFDDAFALAAGLNVADRPTRVVLISDGGVGADDLRLVPDGTRYERVGSSATNRGISQMVVEPADGGLVVRLTVRHFGGPAAEVPLRVDVDGVTVDRRTVELAPGGRGQSLVNLSIRVPPGEKVEAFIQTDDAYVLDDRAVATVSRRDEIEVLVAGPDNPFLDAALAVNPGVTVTRTARLDSDIVTSADSTSVDSASADSAGVDVTAFDLVILDRVAPPAGLAAPMWLIAPPGGGAGVASTGEVERPALTLIDDASPLVSGLDLSEVLLARSQKVELPADAELILGAESAPLLARIRPGPTTTIDGVRVDAVYQSFTIDETNLALLAAFPILVDRILTDLSRAVVPPAQLPVGAWLPIDPTHEAIVTDPTGNTTAIAPGTARVVADRVGFWTVEQGESTTTVAVNPDSAESAIQPATDLPIATAFTDPGDQTATQTGTQTQIPVRRWVVGLLVVVVGVEWLLARRRVGVGAGQWRLAQLMRAGVALALIATFLNVEFDRASDDPATVFIIDGSASMGSEQARAEGWVADALATMPDEARAGVVAFGSNARLDSLVGPNPAFGAITVRVDREGTDLAAAVRLGAATVPSDARTRLVMVTDGRSTSGDLATEIHRLVEDGIPVDLVQLDTATATAVDVAVSSLAAPSSAQVGERVTITATVHAALPAGSPPVSADVILRRGGEVIDTTTVELAAGDNRVSFSDVVTDEAAAVMRYQVDVETASDPVTANNRAFAAVPISGADRVLVVDGRGGEARSATSQVDAELITAALSAAGLPHDRVDVATIPPVDELVRYSSIVLVNVDGYDLSSATVEALTTTVRDLGRGLVVVGGNHSFALGGYLGSDLEELLPLVSEVTDPLRRQTVAEVFAIDTSGSMGACHCDEDGQNGLGGGNRIDGGVLKTAIARQATTRAIAALSATDEVGVVTMDNSDRWVLDLQASPSPEAVEDGLSLLTPDGPTFLRTGLDTAAEQLVESDAALKHIILFSDGFTEPGELERLAERAAHLYDTEGITTSVVATGEGAAEDLRPVAEAGGGRFHPGRNLQQLPDILVQEAVLASRSFINEGEFVPVVTSAARPVANLTEAPVINGYLATTAKPTARVDLRIGPDQDPLLASWQTGLGRVTAWTSDSGTRWNQPWAAWDGYPDFWAGVIKETFPTATDGAGVAATIEGDTMTLRLEAVDPWDDDARATARVTGPDGESQTVALTRVDGETFTGSVPVDEAGVYAVGASVTERGDQTWSGVGLSSRSYPAEYSPTLTVDPALGQLWSATGGRLDPAPSAAFELDGTSPGSRPFDLARWLLWLAVLAWPVAVAVSRLAWRRGALATVENRAAATVDELRRRLPRIDRPAQSDQPARPSGPASPVEPAPAPKPVDSSPPSIPDRPGGEGSTSTLDELLRKKRDR